MAIVLLAIPMVLEMLMQSIFELVDAYFVGRLGADALAAVGVTGTLLILVLAVGIGLSMATTAMVARRIGEKDEEGAGVAAVQGLLIAGAISIPVSLVGIFFAPEILRLMATPESAVEIGSEYCAILFGANAVILFLFLINAIFRGAGDAVLALKVLAFANLLNIILDPLLIFGIGPFPEMGVTGAAVATTIGRSIGVIYQLWYLFDGRGRLDFQLHNLRLVPQLALRMLRISIGGVSQFLISTSSWIVLMRIVAVYGSSAVAAYTVALRVLEFIWLPAWGLGNAAATLVGQNLGAGETERAEKSAWCAARFNTIFMTIVGLVMLLFAPGIANLFSNEPEVVQLTTSCLRILGIGFPVYGIGLVLIQSLNGAGDTVTPTVTNLICFWLVQIPLAHWLATAAGLGPNGVFVAIVVSESLLTLLAVMVFRRGRWKLQKA